ncbi:MAG: DNA polymerase III subunit beta [Actinobacteria bacterium]|nr:DNA polymerase III subunit beta [Actinomycetota bacterium]
MKVHLILENLQKNLSLVNRGVSTKSQLPILLNILLIAKSGKLQLISTDLEIGIQVEIPANIEEEGEITVPAKLFSDLINTLSYEKVTLKTSRDRLEIITERTKNTLQIISSDEFPKLYEDKGILMMVIKKNTLQEKITPVIFAASADTTRPALSGILIKKEGSDSKQGFLFVATDGYRLSLRQQTISDKKELNEEFENQIIIPSRILKEVLNLKGDDQDIKLYISEEKNQILFEQDGVIIVGRLINAQFPDFKKIIPENFLTTVVFDKNEMQKAVKICAIFARERANIIKFSIKENKIIVSANTEDTQENFVEVDAKIIGDENEIAFNARYLLELLSNIEEEEIRFEMSGPLNPGVFKIKDDPSFLHLIMPIRVQG